MTALVVRLRATVGLAVMCVAAAPAVFGQSAPHLSSHTFEVGGFAGASYGLDSWRLMGGGNVTYGITRNILPYAEFSYFPGIKRVINDVFPTSRLPYTAEFDVPITDFHGGVHIRIPIKESKWVPYLVFGMGLLRNSRADYVIKFNDPITGSPDTLPGEFAASNSFAVNGGGGLRYYLNQRLGFRVEAKIYKPTGMLSDRFGKVEGGFFIQFR
jgi:hypothetical protein